MNGSTTELRVLSAWARDASGDRSGAMAELEAAARTAARTPDPRAGYRARAAAAMLAGDTARLDTELRTARRAGFVGLADELHALAQARARHRAAR